MPIFITGGTGFLGVNLVRMLVARGHHVRVLVREESNRLGLTSDLIEFISGDITDAASIRRAIEGCEEVYHLAAWVQVTPWSQRTAWQINVEGTRNVCSAALDLGVRRLVHTSSIATIAAGTPEDPADESTPWNLHAEHIPYYHTKLESEKVAWEFVERGLDVVIVNPTYLIGPWDVKPSAGRMLINVASGRLRCYPKRGGINYVDVQRAAEGHLLAMERGRTGERYILGGENLPFRSFVDRVDRITHTSHRRIALPNAAMYPFAAMGSLAGRVFPRLFRDMNLSILHCASLEHFVSSNKACNELSYEATTIDLAIEGGLRWFVEHGYMTAPPSPAFTTSEPLASGSIAIPNRCRSINQVPEPSRRSGPQP